MSIPPVGGVDPEDFFSTDSGVPFHLLKRKKATQPASFSSQLSINDLNDAFSKFTEKNIKDGLSNFLPHLPGRRLHTLQMNELDFLKNATNYVGKKGYVDAPSTAEDSLQALIEKPPVGGRELLPLSESSLQGFRLMPGSVPEQFKFMNKPPEKKKKKKHKHSEEPNSGEGNAVSGGDTSQDKKHKKRKKEEPGEKKKKDKKKKKKKDKKGEQED